MQDKLDSKLLAICLDHSSDIIKVSESSDEYEYLYFYVDNRENARYLEIFFNSELGRQIYHSNLKFKDSNKTLSTDQIYNLKILIPEKQKLLEDTIEAYEKLNELSRSVNKLKKSFLKNPKETISNDINVLDDMLLAAGSLNEIDEIYALIRREEGSDTEFKETFRLPVGDDVKPEQFTPLSKQISAGVIKVINSFINTNGGDLLIGVRDSDHEITGLQNELDHFFSSKERTILEKQDQFKKHFNSILTNSFKESFVNENIEYKFVDMGDRFVLRVTCSRSKKPCVIKVKSKLNSYLGGDFFFRTGSESKPLHGQEQFDYVHEHFYGNK
jgi:predicted DNA-binding protein